MISPFTALVAAATAAFETDTEIGADGDARESTGSAGEKASGTAVFESLTSAETERRNREVSASKLGLIWRL
jgi:hypothetical protein